MKFQNVLMTLFLSSAWLNSGVAASKSDPHQSSSLDTNLKEVRQGDTERILKPGKGSKKTKKNSKKQTHKKTPAPNPAPTSSTPIVGEILKEPHKMEYEHRSLCVPGTSTYGCADTAAKEKGGLHLHDTIRGRRFVRYTGVSAHKSICDYADEILTGAPPDITHPIGAKLINDDHSIRAQECQKARSAGSTVTMVDPTKYLKFDSVVVENNVKYNKFVSRLSASIDSTTKSKVYNLIHAGLVPDTVVYLQGMDGKPYVIRGTNGSNLMTETKITKFETLSTKDKSRSAEEIAWDFAGIEGPMDLGGYNESFKAHPHGTVTGGKQEDISIPEDCDSDSDICLQIDDSVSLSGATSLNVDFYLNGKSGGSGYLKAGMTTEGLPDPRLLTASAEAEGCIEDGISGTIDLSIQACLDGSFNYDASSDSSPATQTYEVDLSFTASAGVWGHDINLEVEGSLKMTAESDNGNEYFIGYQGLLQETINIDIASAGLGLGVDYKTESYLTYNEPDGWGTKYYGKVNYDIDLWLWHKSGSWTDVFSCHPADNQLCGGSGPPVPSDRIPGSTLNTDTNIGYNEFILSDSGQYKLWQQADGNLVLYGPSGALWASGQSGQAVEYTSFQDDGNLVQYGQGGKVFWAAGTNGRGGNQLIMQDDGNLVIYSTSGSAIWATNTNQR